MLRCEMCGGELVWDYRTGDVICSSCGAVVDRIYVEEKTNQAEERMVRIGRNASTAPKSYRMFRSVYRRMSSGRKLTINNDSFQSFLKTGKHVGVLEHPVNQELRRILSSDEELSMIYRKIERSHAFSGRTMRTKVAAAMIIRSYRHGGEKEVKRDLGEISRVTGLGKWHLYRITALLLPRPPSEKAQRSRMRDP